MKNLYPLLCSYENLEKAFKKAKKRKSQKIEVIIFEQDLKENLLALQNELINFQYFPQPLQSFIISDPKTRKIHKSAFRDRIVHHAICNLIEPLIEKNFIYDSYANRKLKGTLKAIQRFDSFKRKVSKNNTKSCYVFKADIKHYFENVDHNILINILKKQILDKRVISLIKTILKNYPSKKGMPLGNLTSQFFANVYLNELDQFIKHKLKIKYYIRYVDDFVILSSSKEELLLNKKEIETFLNAINLELHPDKSKIIPLSKGIPFLGTKIFFHHKILLKKNKNKFKRKYLLLKEAYTNYDNIYNFIEGWLAYIHYFNTFNHRQRFLCEFQKDFSKEVSEKEVNRLLKTCRKV